MANDGYEIAQGHSSANTIITSVSGIVVDSINIPDNTTINIQMSCSIFSMTSGIDGYCYTDGLVVSRNDSLGIFEIISSSQVYNDTGNYNDMLIIPTLNSVDKTIDFLSYQLGTTTCRLTTYTTFYSIDNNNIITIAPEVILITPPDGGSVSFTSISFTASWNKELVSYLTATANGSFLCYLYYNSGTGLYEGSGSLFAEGSATMQCYVESTNYGTVYSNENTVTLTA